MASGRLGGKSAVFVAACVAGTVAFLAENDARAQTPTFYLDRLQIPGAPDDGMVMFRPVTQPRPIFYAQLGIGYQLNPLKTVSIVGRDAEDKAVIKASDRGVVRHQLTVYMAAGFEFLNRFTVSLNF